MLYFKLKRENTKNRSISKADAYLCQNFTSCILDYLIYTLFAYVLFFLMALVLLKSIKGVVKEAYSESDKKLGLFAMIIAHIS